ncbi:universal stress protein [Halegenticoccus soli]|uniref:universal stress protein n=1 Tax=Halegenticoccus soli TaxID=1985678 RepID=UPI000C6E0B64|nr:universal stress protein [Halegenticoccus soli]
MHIDSTVALQAMPSGGRDGAADGVVLVPVFGEGAMTNGRELSYALATEGDAELLFLHPVTVPAPVEPSGDVQADHGEVAELAWRARNDAGIDASGTVRVGRDPVRTVLDEVDRAGIETLVLQESIDRGLLEGVRLTTVEQITVHADADVVVTNGQGSLGAVSSVLVPVAGGPHSGFAVEVAGALARYKRAWIDLLHVVPPEADDECRREAEARFDAARERLGDFERVDSWTLEADDVAEAIIEQSEYYDATVLGAPTKSRLRQLVFGSTTDAVRRDATTPVVVARRNTDESLLDRWLLAEG